MDAPEISVYGEAKGEYTRQLTIFLLPCLETYFLELLEQAKQQAPSQQKVLWYFQGLLQAIPDWNQDKVLRETEKIQKDCGCDYLEELLTAVFIAHTKILSAIRLTTKQKKLQITIPKLDHFLHRVLSDSARSLWTNAFLFADTNSIEKQKNLRQVSSLLQEAILQAIRGLLPVKSILREYLHDDEDEEEGGAAAAGATTEQEPESAAHASPALPVLAPALETTPLEPAVPIVPPIETPSLEPVLPIMVPVEKVTEPIEVPVPVAEAVAAPTPTPETSEPEAAQQQPPVINIDTKPSVSFAQEHVFFDSDNLEANEIQNSPFAEAENRPPEEDDDEDDDELEEEIESLEITDEVLPMDAEELSL